MFDVDPSLVEAPYHEEIIVDGETKAIGSLKVLYDDMYAFIEDTPRTTNMSNQPCVEQVSLVLYTRASCPYCQRVFAYLRSAGKMSSIGKTIIVRDISRDPQYTIDLVQAGGKRQVPCLVNNGQALYESKDIIDWLKHNQDKY